MSEYALFHSDLGRPSRALFGRPPPLNSSRCQSDETHLDNSRVLVRYLGRENKK